MTYKYVIYQLDDSKEQAMHKMFLSFDFLIKSGKQFDINDYKQVYEGEIEGGISEHFVLEELFEIFNIRHPEDFTGHSMSTSDVVDLNGQLWYCDSFGWHKL